MPNKPKPSLARCPICGKPSDPQQRPFCSARCRQVDLGRWLNEAYVIPGPPVPQEDETRD
ncbi:DNA gyrase inhibitor YacG [Roseomonas marmotae]|uniref:DNA gyrase inhibitor YacG n=1 Tax=Roseomonas marmotae TaxID=2768161 RepID=A0ABS3KBN7_9PROT|nr:DNA gyrase inhibitor YacG [Roseomonas marmotae]MBO1074887.1 DNA gyrase inhibitor YacG [Roseomonas marmotae]QTI80611.1 DNA gyrase inhibitor YacG [Roseomonas marmotae]